MNTLIVYAALLCLGQAGTDPHAHRGLTEQGAVELAWTSSPRLAAARHARMAALVGADREKPVARPTLSAQLEGRLQGPRVTFPRAGAEDATVLPESYYRLQLEVEQPVYRPGVGAAWSRFRSAQLLAELELLKAANEVARDVRKAFQAVLLAEAALSVAQEGVKLAEAQQEQTRNLLAEGLVPPRDLTAGEADLAEAEQGLIRARNGLALARADLARLTGDRQAADAKLVETPLATEDLPELSALEAKALAQRVELRQVRAGLESARAGLALSKTQVQPMVSARALLSRQTGSAFERPTYAAGGLLITWNLLDGDKARLDASEAGHHIAELEAQEREARAGILLEVQKAWRDAQDARARLAAAERQVEAALKSLEIARTRYEERAAIQLEVSGALFGVLRARSNVAQARYDLRVALVELRYALGDDVPQSRQLVVGVNAPPAR